MYAPLGVLLSVSLLAPPVAPLHAAAAPPPPAPGGEDPSSLSEEERLNRAKQLFGEGDAAFQQGDYTTALARFEEAYNVYAPSIHVFNFNIGQAAWELGDCWKAKTSLQRFLDLVPNHPARGDAQERLLEIERQGCSEPEPEPVETAPIVSNTPVADNDDAPILESRSRQREEAAEREIEQRNEQRKPLLISGAVLTGLGALALVGGGISAWLADRKAARLADLASSGPTGFPAGDYSDDEVFELDRNRLLGNNIATVTLFAAGGVLVVTGVALLAVHGARQKKKGGGNANAGFGQRWTASPAMLPGGGGLAAGFRF